MEHLHLAVLSPAGTEGRRATIQALSLVFGVKVLLFIREKLITESSLDVTATVTRTPWKPYCNGNTISKCKAQRFLQCFKLQSACCKDGRALVAFGLQSREVSQQQS